MEFTRRKFVATSFAALSGSALFSSSVYSGNFDQQSMTIAQVIEKIKASIGLDVSKGTVDTIKSGDPEQPVTGIVTTMFATVDVIRKAIDLKANLIIAHEPTFYNHLDETEWLKDHDVYRFKRDLLTEHNIVVWRFHDFWHANDPDGVFMGVITALGWEKYHVDRKGRLLALPPTSLHQIINHLKKQLGIEKIRYMGDPSQLCARVALMPGASGGRSHMTMLHNEKPDLLICGELQEWETSEYMRDLQAMGEKKSLIVLGHALSEEPGMNWLVQWLQPKVGSIKVTHLPSGNPFSFA